MVEEKNSVSSCTIWADDKSRWVPTHNFQPQDAAPLPPSNSVGLHFDFPNYSFETQVFFWNKFRYNPGALEVIGCNRGKFPGIIFNWISSIHKSGQIDQNRVHENKTAINQMFPTPRNLKKFLSRCQSINDNWAHIWVEFGWRPIRGNFRLSKSDTVITVWGGCCLGRSQNKRKRQNIYFCCLFAAWFLN